MSGRDTQPKLLLSHYLSVFSSRQHSDQNSRVVHDSNYHFRGWALASDVDGLSDFPFNVHGFLVNTFDLLTVNRIYAQFYIFILESAQLFNLHNYIPQPSINPAWHSLPSSACFRLNHLPT